MPKQKQKLRTQWPHLFLQVWADKNIFSWGILKRNLTDFLEGKKCQDWILKLFIEIIEDPVLKQDKNRDLLTISQQMLSFSLRYNFVNDLEAPWKKLEISREELKIASSFWKSWGANWSSETEIVSFDAGFFFHFSSRWGHL